MIHIGRLCGGAHRNLGWFRKFHKGFASDKLGLIVWWD